MQLELLKVKQLLDESEESRDAETRRAQRLAESNSKLTQMKSLLQQQLESPADSVAVKRVGGAVVTSNMHRLITPLCKGQATEERHISSEGGRGEIPKSKF